jgi:hypothetical protein
VWRRISCTVYGSALSILVATFCFHPTAMTHFSRNGLLGKQQSDSAQREGRTPARAVQRRVRLLLDMCACRLTCAHVDVWGNYWPSIVRTVVDRRCPRADVRLMFTPYAAICNTVILATCRNKQRVWLCDWLTDSSTPPCPRNRSERPTSHRPSRTAALAVRSTLCERRDSK